MPINKLDHAGPTCCWKTDVTASKLAAFNDIKRELRRHRYQVSTREDLDELLDKFIQHGTEILASLPKLDPLPEKKVKTKVVKKGRVKGAIGDAAEPAPTGSPLSTPSTSFPAAASRAMEFLKPD